MKLHKIIFLALMLTVSEAISFPGMESVAEEECKIKDKDGKCKASLA